MFSFAKSEYCKANLFDESPVKNVPADRPPIQWHTRMLGLVQQQKTIFVPYAALLKSRYTAAFIYARLPPVFSFLCISQRIPLHFLF